MSAVLYQIALTKLPGIGNALAKNLLAYCGSAEAVFKSPKHKLLNIPTIGEERADAILGAEVLKEAEKELRFMDDNNITAMFFTAPEYPTRLKQCTDSPIMLYYKGNANLNAEKIVGVVGTRRATEYGKEFTKKLISELAATNVLVVSGLAYGIDIAAHNAALENNLPTVGVLGHGLQSIYPPQHTNAAKKMLEQGGLLTEYSSTDEILQHNFPERNRIIAGISDAVVVVESAIQGGAVITANIAASYNRDVFAVPGRTIDKVSAGCNFLIKTNKAAIIESAKDLLAAMRWDENATTPTKRKQITLALNLSDTEKNIHGLLNAHGELEIDKLALETGLNTSTLAATLLEMEMNSLIVSLPGKRYKLV